MNLLALVVIAAVGVVAYIALRNAQDFSDANEVVPGVPTNAPKEWAGAHSPEARMHRRLRDAVDALRANSALDDPALTPIRAELEQQALAVDEQLVAAAALPKPHRGEAIQRVEESVAAVEAAVASVVELRGPALDSVERGIEEVRTRLALVEAARAELEGLSASPDLDELRHRLSAEETGIDPESGEAPGAGGGA